MLETGNNISTKKTRITLRFSRNTLSFSAIDKTTSGQLRFQPYIVKSGISMAANLREAFKEDNMLQEEYDRAQVLPDSPVLLIPVEEFKEDSLEMLYNHAFLKHEGELIKHIVLPELNVIAAFAVNKDLNVVLNDHFSDIRFIPTMLPVWNYLHRRSFTGIHKKLYGYFHDQKLDIFSFDKNRFKFANVFDTPHSKDAVYFLLYVWKQLNLDTHHDELYIVGDIPEREKLVSMLKLYLQKVFAINPSALLNRAPITQIKGLPFDLLALYTK